MAPILLHQTYCSLEKPIPMSTCNIYCLFWRKNVWSLADTERGGKREGKREKQREREREGIDGHMHALTHTCTHTHTHTHTHTETECVRERERQRHTERFDNIMNQMLWLQSACPWPCWESAGRSPISLAVENTNPERACRFTQQNHKGKWRLTSHLLYLAVWACVSQGSHSLYFITYFPYFS